MPAAASAKVPKAIKAGRTEPKPKWKGPPPKPEGETR
jgi:hypothetical protein